MSGNEASKKVAEDKTYKWSPWINLAIAAKTVYRQPGVPPHKLVCVGFGSRIPSRDLKRFYGAGDLHFITFSCYRRRPFLVTWSRRDMFLRALENTARDYQLTVIGYVVMPEHVHLLVSEPERENLSTVIKALKQSVAGAWLNFPETSSLCPASKKISFIADKYLKDINQLSPT